MQMVIFGRVVMLRDFCERCERTALVLDGKLACCDTPIRANQSITSMKREVVTIDVRRLTVHQRDYILERQGNRCFYCNKLFGSTCFYRGRQIKITKTFDHIVPVAYQTDNSTPNVVAACRQCNQWKSSTIFTSMEEARAFLSDMWEKKREAPKVGKGSRVKVVKYGVINSEE